MKWFLFLFLGLIASFGLMAEDSGYVNGYVTSYRKDGSGNPYTSYYYKTDDYSEELIFRPGVANPTVVRTEYSKDGSEPKTIVTNNVPNRGSIGAPLGSNGKPVIYKYKKISDTKYLKQVERDGKIGDEDYWGGLEMSIYDPNYTGYRGIKVKISTTYPGLEDGSKPDTGYKGGEIKIITTYPDAKDDGSKVDPEGVKKGSCQWSPFTPRKLIEGPGGKGCTANSTVSICMAELVCSRNKDGLRVIKPAICGEDQCGDGDANACAEDVRFTSKKPVAKPTDKGTSSGPSGAVKQ